MTPSQSQRITSISLAALTIPLSAAVIGCAAHALNTFNAEKQTNNYFLPLWPGHFDVRGLTAAIATSSVIVVLNLGALVALSLPLAYQSRLANIYTISSGFFSTILSIISLGFNFTLNAAAPNTDTLQTWTCSWSSAYIAAANGVPSDFAMLCQETKYATYAPIVGIILQLLLLGLATHAFVLASRNDRSPGRKFSSDDSGLEKDGESTYELTNVKAAGDQKKRGTVVFGRAV